MRKHRWLLPLAGLAFGLVAGCVNIDAPEKIEVGTRERAEPVDSARIPPTASHEEARAELRKAYAYLREVEQERDHWRKKAAKYKQERDKCERRLDDCEDRLEKYEDD